MPSDKDDDDDDDKDKSKHIRFGRMDDRGFELMVEDTILCPSRLAQYETAVNGNLVGCFDPNSSLRTIDWHRHGSLRDAHASFFNGQDEDNFPEDPPNVNVLYEHCIQAGAGHHQQELHSWLATVDNFLSEWQCEELLRNTENHATPQHYHYNRSDRLIVIDSELSDNLWNRLEPILIQHGLIHTRETQDGNGEAGRSSTCSTCRIRPLGFGTSSVNDWTLTKLNPAMRINSYGQNGQRFGIHRDAQFSESRKARSVLTMIIYLNNNNSDDDGDVVEGGETVFYIPPKSTGPESLMPKTGLGSGEDLVDAEDASSTDSDDDEDSFKSCHAGGMTIKEELQFYRDKYGEMETIQVVPKQGRCVLFTHDLLHESMPVFKVDEDDVDDDPPTPLASALKVVLRTDVVAITPSMPSFESAQEVCDYQEALALFCEAEQRVRYDRLQFDDETCDAYYEISLFLRYRYPQALYHATTARVEGTAPNCQLRDASYRSDCNTSSIESLGVVLVNVLEFLPVKDVLKLSIVYPEIQGYAQTLQEAQDHEARKWFQCQSIDVTEGPSQERRNSPATMEFTIQSDLDFDTHYKGWCRVITMLIVHRLTHPVAKMSGTGVVENETNERPWYCARFVPQTGQVVAVPLERLLYDAFHNHKCYGAIFRVDQQGSRPNVESDFQNSVDRSIMIRDYGIEFVGHNLMEHGHVETTGGHNSRWPGHTASTGGGVCDDLSYDTADDLLYAARSVGLDGTCALVTDQRKRAAHRHIYSCYSGHGNYECYSGSCERVSQLKDSPPATSFEMRKNLVFNQCIFDFENCQMEIRKVDGQDRQPYYEVEIVELAKRIEPFYHAAAYYSFADDLTFRASAYSETGISSTEDRVITIRPVNLGKGKTRVVAQWSTLCFPITL